MESRKGPGLDSREKKEHGNGEEVAAKSEGGIQGVFQVHGHHACGIKGKNGFANNLSPFYQRTAIKARPAKRGGPSEAEPKSSNAIFSRLGRGLSRKRRKKRSRLRRPES